MLGPKLIDQDIYQMTDWIEITIYSVIALVAGLIVAQIINEKLRK